MLAVLCVLTGCDSLIRKPTGVIKHPSVYDRNVISAVEYILPANEMPDGEHVGLDPWIRQLRGKRSAEVKQLLVERWSTIKNPALCELRDRLLEFQPVSILVHKGQGWLTLQLPNAEQGSGDIWYLPAPQADIDWPAKLKDVGLQDNAVVSEFVQHFAGLRESIPDAAGNFLDRGEFETFPLSGYKLSDVKGTPDWQGSRLVVVRRTRSRRESSGFGILHSRLHEVQSGLFLSVRWV